MEKEIKAIWEDLNQELYRFMVGKLKDEQLSKDLHQEVFFKVQTKIHQLKHTSKLTAWVYQIARNTILDHFRKENQRKLSLEHYHLPETETEDFEYSSLSNCINQKIENLSSEHKEAIVLTSFQDYSQKKLAEHLNISYSGTKSRVQKAREVLRKNILDCPNVESDPSGKLIDFENNDH